VLCSTTEERKPWSNVDFVLSKVKCIDPNNRAVESGNHSLKEKDGELVLIGIDWKWPLHTSKLTVNQNLDFSKW
jgi:hypothetical protein